MAISHAGHNHPATPAGRRACRAGNVVVVERPQDEIKMTGPVARRMARHAMKAENARIQPRRSGARVSINTSGCVQAALHIDAHGGRCACGWAAEKVA